MAKPSDYSPGGTHVYDRTTGTWAETGSPSYSGDGVGRGTLVIHDANGPVGVHLAAVNRPAAGYVSTGSGGSGAAAGVVETNGAGSAGTGPGAASVVTGGPLKPKMKPTTTSLMIGAPVTPNPWFSNADQWEERYGEPGDWLGGVVVAGADVLQAVGFNSEKAGNDLYNAPGVVGGALTTIGQGFLDMRAAQKDPFGPDKPMPGFATGGF